MTAFEGLDLSASTAAATLVDGTSGGSPLLAALKELRQALDAHLLQVRERLVGEVRETSQRVAPWMRGLVQALQQEDEILRGAQLRLFSANVDHGLDQRDRSVQHGLQVCLVIVDWHGKAPHVCLQEEVGLGVRRVESLDC